MKKAAAGFTVVEEKEGAEFMGFKTEHGAGPDVDGGAGDGVAGESVDPLAEGEGVEMEVSRRREDVEFLAGGFEEMADSEEFGEIVG